MSKILIEKIKEDLRQLRLTDMARALDSILKKAELERQGYLAFLDQLISKQLEARTERSLERRIKKAGLSRHMSFETFDWNFQPALNVEYVKDLAGLGFIAHQQPLLILGKIGTGKTHLANAFAIRACEAGYKVGFYTLQALLKKLYATIADDTTDELIAKLVRLDLLIIDALGHIRTKPECPSLMLELVEACRHHTALIITSNISFQQWGQILANPSITNAIVDRLFDHACLININPGRSYRTQGPHAPQFTQTQDLSENP
jgi:DNA replication protein DnaC